MADVSIESPVPSPSKGALRSDKHHNQALIMDFREKRSSEVREAAANSKTIQIASDDKRERFVRAFCQVVGGEAYRLANGKVVAIHQDTMFDYNVSMAVPLGGVGADWSKFEPSKEYDEDDINRVVMIYSEYENRKLRNEVLALEDLTVVTALRSGTAYLVREGRQQYVLWLIRTQPSEIYADMHFLLNVFEIISESGQSPVHVYRTGSTTHLFYLLTEYVPQMWA